MNDFDNEVSKSLGEGMVNFPEEINRDEYFEQLKVDGKARIEAKFDILSKASTMNNPYKQTQ